MSMLDYAGVASRLGINVQEEVINQINRSVVLQAFIDVVPASNKAVTWDVKVGTGIGSVKADGADLSSGDFQSDTKVQASLNFGCYQDAFMIGGLARAVSRVTNNPSGLRDVFMDELSDCAERVGKLINQDLYTGAATSPMEITGLTDGSTGGALGSSGSYAGLDRSTYPQWAATRLANGGIERVLSKVLMRQMRQSIYEASGEKPDLIICDAFQHRAYGELSDQKRQFTDMIRMRGQEIKLDVGYNLLEFDGVPVVEDVDAPEGTMMFLNTRQMRIVQVADTSDDQNGGKGFTLASGTPEEQLGPAKRKLSLRLNPLAKLGDHIKFQLIGYIQLQLKRPNAMGQIVDLKTS
jgi:hypothetical protein